MMMVLPNCQVTSEFPHSQQYSIHIPLNLISQDLSFYYARLIDPKPSLLFPSVSNILLIN